MTKKKSPTENTSRNTTTPTNKKDGTSKPTTKKSKGSKPVASSEQPKPGEPLKTNLLEAAQKHVKPKAAPPPRENRVENFERELPCKLTDSQVLEKSRERSYLGSLIDQKTGALELKKKEFKQQLEALQQEIDTLAAQDKQIRLMIQLGTQNRLVNCQRVFDYSLAQVRELRLDTIPPQTVTEARAMSPAELDEGRGNWTGTAFEGVKVVETDDDEGVVDDSYGKPNPITGLSDEGDLNAKLSDFDGGDND